MDSRRLDGLMLVYNSRSRARMTAYEIAYCHAEQSRIIYEAALANPDLNDVDQEQARDNLYLTYLAQGKYLAALRLYEDIDPDSDKVLHAAEMIAAMDRPDDEICDCPIKPVQHERIWSSKHNGWAYHTICLACGDKNITTQDLT